MAETPVLDPDSRKILPNPNQTGLFPPNLNLGRTPLFGSYGTMSNNPLTTPSPTAFGSTNTYDAALTSQAGDYDRIMADYDKLLKSSSGAVEKLSYTPITPQLSNYQGASFTPSAGVGAGLLKEAATTGGFSESDIGNIRARAVSPIRSIYANAQRNLDRNKSLQGGYSPNYAATSAKMARELSEQVGQANTNIEGAIAEMVGRNKLSAISSLAPLEAEEARMRNQIALSNAEGASRTDLANSEIINRTNEQNRMMPLNYSQINRGAEDDFLMGQLRAIEGKRSLYGTTPALTNMFGNQVLNAQQLAQQAAATKAAQKQNQTTTAAQLLDAFGRPRTQYR